MLLGKRNLTLGEDILEVVTEVFHNYEHIQLAVELELVTVDQFDEEIRHLGQLSEDLDLSDGFDTVVLVFVDVLNKFNSYFKSGGITGCSDYLAITSLANDLEWGVVLRNLSPFWTKVKGSHLYLFCLGIKMLDWFHFNAKALLTFYPWGGVIKHVYVHFVKSVYLL